jgi:hypothetical protein
VGPAHASLFCIEKAQKVMGGIKFNLSALWLACGFGQIGPTQPYFQASGFRFIPTFHGKSHLVSTEPGGLIFVLSLQNFLGPKTRFCLFL